VLIVTTSGKPPPQAHERICERFSRFTIIQCRSAIAIERRFDAGSNPRARVCDRN
jgi:hypothetical protein